MSALASPATHPAFAGVDPKVAGFDGCRRASGGPAQQGADAGGQHPEAERLGQVVVGAGVAQADSDDDATEGGDEDSYYEVEVTVDDGSQVDVQLDEQFAVVSALGDSESHG